MVNKRGRQIRIDHMHDSLTELYYSYKLIVSVTNTSNRYIEMRRVELPNLN